MTIIYYTSNRENPEFEKKIQADLLKKAGDIPIVSVSQKPIKLGKNICVGDVGTSGYNVCRQIQIACEAATTDYVIATEADCLYSPDYFTWVPPKLDVCYRNSNIYVLKYHRDYFCKKKHVISSMIIGRKFYLKRLNELFGDAPRWDSTLKNWPKEWGKKFFDGWEYFETKNPNISIKTGQGMRHHTSTGPTKFYELPYWGKAKDIRKRLCT